MDKNKLLTFTGLTTWLELYDFLQKRGFTELPEVKITKPRTLHAVDDGSIAPKDPQPDEDWTVNICELQAACFLEILPKLPTITEKDNFKRLVYVANGDYRSMEAIEKKIDAWPSKPDL